MLFNKLTSNKTKKSDKWVKFVKLAKYDHKT